MARESTGEGRIDAPNINAYVVGSSAGDTQEVNPAATPAKQTAPKQEAAKATFDPGEHTVAEVEAYLDEHPEEESRILRAERAGKNRATLVGD